MDEARAEDRGAKVERPLTRGVPFLWGLVALAIVALMAAAALSLIRADRGPRPAFLDAPPDASIAEVKVAAERRGALVLAGSGSNLPLTRALAASFMERHADARIVVAESIGSGGGIRAVHDGVIDVGLISRPMQEAEAELGLSVTPYARVPVVVAANPTAPDACVASASLAGMWSGKGASSRWSDGTPVVVLQRERGDSSFLVVSRARPELGVENEVAYGEKRWRVLYDDRSMQEALMATEGALGIFDFGEIVAQRLPLKMLCVDGVTPSVEAVLAGQYPYSKDLAFVTRGEGAAAAAASRGASLAAIRAMIAFVRSPEGRALTRTLGYAPLPLEAGGGAP